MFCFSLLVDASFLVDQPTDSELIYHHVYVSFVSYHIVLVGAIFVFFDALEIPAKQRCFQSGAAFAIFLSVKMYLTVLPSSWRGGFCLSTSGFQDAEICSSDISRTCMTNVVVFTGRVFWFSIRHPDCCSILRKSVRFTRCLVQEDSEPSSSVVVPDAKDSTTQLETGKIKHIGTIYSPVHFVFEGPMFRDFLPEVVQQILKTRL